MTPSIPLKALVHTLRYEAEGITSVELRPVPGAGPFPAFTAGAHIDLHLPGGLVRSYSLLNDPAEQHRYVVAVLKERASRGGSRAVHEQLHVGQWIDVDAPRNHFALDESAPYSVLVAGGIGITPLLSMARRLQSLGRPFELFYAARSRLHAAFLRDLEGLGIPLRLHFDAEAGGPPDLRSQLQQAAQRAQAAGQVVQPAEVHFYACGPAVMLDAFEAHCAALGYAHAHLERFSAVPVAASADARGTYQVELRRSGMTLVVSPDTTLLRELEAARVFVPTSCQEGICGTCETPVLEGEPDHRDSVLSPAERAANRSMMVCVSGCRSERLVLDL